MKNIIIALFLLCIPFISNAQRKGGRGEEIKAYKISYMKEKLELLPEEAKVFWPIYNALEAEQSALRAERRSKMISFRKLDEIDNMTDLEVQASIVNELNFKQRELNIEKKYYARLKSSLPIKIIGRYYRAQENFKRELLSRYRSGNNN